MPTYGFTIHVRSIIPDDDFERWSNLLWEAGCDDSSPSIHCGKPYVHFDRDADSLDAALSSALRAVQSTGVIVDRVEIAADGLAVLTAEN